MYYNTSRIFIQGLETLVFGAVRCITFRTVRCPTFRMCWYFSGIIYSTGVYVPIIIIHTSLSMIFFKYLSSLQIEIKLRTLRDEQLHEQPS